MIAKFADEEFIDGCYSGIMRLQDIEDTNTEEYLSFTYDIELNTINITRRSYPGFNAPIINEWPDYLVENDWAIRCEIRDRYNNRT